MRYDDWDVILFPKDSQVPIQEFKTACYVSPDEYGRQLPILTCYISSLPPSTPFRISVHSWATTAKASALIESRRKANQKVVYTVQVVVNGARVFRGFFDVASKWPQEIAHEKRSLTFVEQPSSQRKPCLEFPPFDQQILKQSSWDARDHNGRIRVVLSEQLISKTSSPGELDLGVTNDIVSFSFQHAPKDVLEQAGISWPIRNPLYLPNAHEQATLPSQTSPSFPCASKARTQVPDAHIQSPIAQPSKPMFARPQNPAPFRRPHPHLPPISHFPKPPNSGRDGARINIWEDSFTSFVDSGDDTGIDSWPTKRTASNSTGDMAMPDYMYASSHPSRIGPPWTSTIPHSEQSSSMGWKDYQPKEKDRQVVVTLRDDQLGQIIEAMSPPKRNRELPQTSGNQRHEHASRPPTAHAYYPPKINATQVMNRPSSAAMARTSSYPDFNNALRNASNKPSPDNSYSHESVKDNPPVTYYSSVSGNKENRPPSQTRLPTPYPYANRVPTPNPFVQRLPTFNSDIAMRDASSFSNSSRFDRSGMPPPPVGNNKTGPSHAPSATGSVKSRKEGMSSNSPRLPEQAVRHDRSLLPPTSSGLDVMQKPAHKDHEKAAHDTPKSVPASAEVIDVDAIDPGLGESTSLDNTKLSPFKPNHKSGMSSIDSTGRLERQLFSALGEELGSFDQQIDTTGMGPELAQALGGTTAHSDINGNTMLNPSASEFEPTAKRKRQGTLGGERDRSPVSKKEKSKGVESEEVVLRLRGD